MKITKSVQKLLSQTSKTKGGLATKEALIEVALAAPEGEVSVLELSVLIDIRDIIAESLVAGGTLASLQGSVKAIADRIALQP